MLFAILQKYDFSSKSQQLQAYDTNGVRCLRYCKSTIFQANHNNIYNMNNKLKLFAILQKYDFSSKSQHNICSVHNAFCCLRYCKSTIFQANHNGRPVTLAEQRVVCDTAKVRFFKQITTSSFLPSSRKCCLRYCKSTIFQANHNPCRLFLLFG